MPVDIEALKALCEKATPGPWGVEEDAFVWQLFALTKMPAPGGGEEWLGHPMQLIKAPKRSHEFAEYWPSFEDGAFIAAARTAVPELIAEIERLRAMLDAAADMLIETAKEK